MSCSLHFAGESFDPHSIPKLLALRPSSVNRRGDKVPGNSGFDDRWGLSDLGRVCFEVSDREPPADMIEDAIDYLSRHHELLMELAGLTAIRYRFLSIFIESEQSEANHCSLELPSLLLRLAADLDLDVHCSFFVWEPNRGIHPEYRR